MHRRAAGDPHPAGDERPDGDRRAAREIRPPPRQARARELDGGRIGPARRGDPRPRRHPDLRLPRHGRPDVHPDVAVALQSPGAVRDPEPAGRRCGFRRRPRGRRVDRRRGPRRGPDRTHRIRVEAHPGRLRHPHGRDPRRHRRGRGGRRRRGDRLSGRPQAALANDHPQDRCRRRAAQPGGCRGGPPRLPVDRGIRAGTAPARGISTASACSRWPGSTATN